ncbi:antizyme inhibitor 2-like isoform X2 [Ambystoma mexicanum]|uniref:antizyme inhibitor 2-like isoform X2 n=1 Tax=Ambystoma mexicanum TaxID=8296 RepID=UPI0037E9C281
MCTATGSGTAVQTLSSSQGRSMSVEAAMMEAGTSTQDALELMIQERTLSGDQDAFMVADLREVVKKHYQFQKALPNVMPFYAVKCNARKEVIATLAKLGTGFDCASKGEMELVLGLGVSPNMIIYANPCKQRSHLQYAAMKGVRMMTFDNEEELPKVAKYHPTARMLLRIQTDDSHSFGQLSSKFGATLGSCGRLLGVARDLGVAVVGVSFHVGSSSQNVPSYTQAIADARKVFQTGTELGHHMQLLDVGGGFPGTEDVQPSFEEMAAAITSALSTHFPEDLRVKFMAEPGRFYVTTAFSAALNVIAKKEVIETAGGSDCTRRRLIYYLNDGIFGSFNFLLFEENRLQPLVVKFYHLRAQQDVRQDPRFH